MKVQKHEKKREKDHCKKLVGIRMAQSKELQVEGEHSILKLPTLCLFGHCSVWLLSGKMHETIWNWIIIFFLMFWNTQLDYCASFTHTLISIFHEHWLSYLLSMWLFSVTPCFSQFFWHKICFCFNLIIVPRTWCSKMFFLKSFF